MTLKNQSLIKTKNITYQQEKKNENLELKKLIIPVQPNTGHKFIDDDDNYYFPKH